MSLDTFNTNSMFHLYDTQNKSKLFITRHNTTLFEQSIAYNGVLIYKRLPSEIKGIKSTTLFKKTPTKFLLEKERLFNGRIYDCKFLKCRNCVVGMYL
jgi:hypothetical protein